MNITERDGRYAVMSVKEGVSILLWCGQPVAFVDGPSRKYRRVITRSMPQLANVRRFEKDHVYPAGVRSPDDGHEHHFDARVIMHAERFIEELNALTALWRNDEHTISLPAESA